MTTATTRATTTAYHQLADAPASDLETARGVTVAP
jgi:hypothetical protein